MISFPSELVNLRLAHQQISVHTLRKPREIVSWMGAMQAQDYSMVRWAIGARLAHPEVSSIQRSIDRGEIIRTHVLRPTWHLVSSEDASWMIDLAAPQIKAAAKSRQKELELTPSVLKRCIGVMEKVLADGNHLTRDEVLLQLQKNRIDTNGQRAAYILLWGEVEKAICSGPMVNNKNTYALFDDRVRNKRMQTRDQSLVALADRYFRSRGPATIHDFINWSALPVADARKALEAVSHQLVREKAGNTEYWFPDSRVKVPSGPHVCLLPAFDEFVIGYKDRSAMLSQRHKSSVISINGIFWPVIVVNGMVTGLWKRTNGRRGVKIDLKFFPGTGIRKQKDIYSHVEEEVLKVKTFFEGAAH